MIAFDGTSVETRTRSYQDIVALIYLYNCSTSNASIYTIVWIKIYPVNNIIIDQEFRCLFTVISQSNCPGKHVYPGPWCKERTLVRVIGISNVCNDLVKSKNVMSSWRLGIGW